MTHQKMINEDKNIVVFMGEKYLQEKEKGACIGLSKNKLHILGKKYEVVDPNFRASSFQEVLGVSESRGSESHSLEDISKVSRKEKSANVGRMKWQIPYLLILFVAIMAVVAGISSFNTGLILGGCGLLILVFFVGILLDTVLHDYLSFEVIRIHFWNKKDIAIKEEWYSKKDKNELVKKISNMVE
jgi:hypothetical protein